MRGAGTHARRVETLSTHFVPGGPESVEMSLVRRDDAADTSVFATVEVFGLVGKRKVEVTITVDFTSVLAQLRKERDAIDAAISNLESLDRGGRRDAGHQRNLVAKGSSNGANHGSRLPDLPADEG